MTALYYSPVVPAAYLPCADASVVAACCSLLTNQSGLQPDKSRSACNINYEQSLLKRTNVSC